MENQTSSNEEGRQQLTKRERRELRRMEEAHRNIRERRKKMLKKALIAIIAVLVVGSGIFAIGWYITTLPSLPPTTIQGHTEDMPQAHITDSPIPDSMQRHMLEHADGRGKPGIIIQYNCKKYACEPDLIQKLIDLVKKYPDNVYLAPNNYDGKIILTKNGKLEILNVFDEEKIKKFIE